MAPASPLPVPMALASPPPMSDITPPPPPSMSEAIAQAQELAELRQSLEEERRRADTLQQELGATRSRLQEVDIERHIAYFRAEFFLRSYSYVSRDPSAHRVQPAIPIYPWPHDIDSPADRLDKATTTYLGDRDTCSVCVEDFD